jgi:cyclopropane fatty-acyl-phospholipid synthase-like methyltransferase
MYDVKPGALRERLYKSDFPRASAYDPQWLMENVMGPHVLWLAEWLSQRLELRSGMRILDLGCGRAISSIFFAKEFGVIVCAADLWIKPTENSGRIEQAGMSAQVFPILAEAHDLPFAHESFDAIVSLDAYHYFGTDDLYLGYISKFLKPEGQIGIVVPGVQEELSKFPPPHVAPYWVWDFCSFHSPQWWHQHWEKTGLVDLRVADALPNGWKLWLEWNEVCAERGLEKLRRLAQQEAEMLRTDDGRTFGFTRVIARKPAA